MLSVIDLETYPEMLIILYDYASEELCLLYPITEDFTKLSVDPYIYEDPWEWKNDYSSTYCTDWGIFEASPD